MFFLPTELSSLFVQWCLLLRLFFGLITIFFTIRSFQAPWKWKKKWEKTKKIIRTHRLQWRLMATLQSIIDWKMPRHGAYLLRHGLKLAHVESRHGINTVLIPCCVYVRFVFFFLSTSTPLYLCGIIDIPRHVCQGYYPWNSIWYILCCFSVPIYSNL